MNVRSICLAILYTGDRTGYDIRKISTEGEFSFFIDASYGSIYPALNRLEDEGMVTFRHEVQDGKPARKVYSITKAGCEALVQELVQPHKPDIFRSEFLLISIFARIVGPDVIRAAIDRQIEQSEQELALIHSCDRADTERCLQMPDSIDAQLDLQATQWAQNYGYYCVKAGLDYLRMYGDALVDIARLGQPLQERYKHAAQ